MAEVSTRSAVLILLLFALLLGARFWAYGETIGVNGVSYLHPHPAGDIGVLLDNHLYRLDGHDRLRQVIDLAQYGVPPDQVTDFAWFSNGDLLLRQGRREEGLWFGIERFRRQDNRTADKSEQTEATLFRCDTSAGQCRPFTQPALNLNDAFSLEIDWQTDRVFVADTSRHQVYLLSARGQELDRYRTDLKFPNQLLYRDGKLFITNTNRHQVTVVDVDDDRFGALRQRLPVTPREAQAAGQRWPAALLLTDDGLWVVNATHAMDDGGLYRFDRDGEYRQRVALPADADPFALLEHAGQILVSDIRNDRIYRISRSGALLGEYFPAPLAAALGEVRDQRARYSLLTDALTVLFIVALAAGFVIALYRQQRPSTGTTDVAPADRPLININDPDITWIETDRKARRMLLVLPLILVPFMIMVLPLSGKAGSDSWITDPLTLGLLLLFTVALLVTVYLMLRRRIGVRDDVIILVDHRGNYAAGRGRQVLYSHNIVMIDKLFVTFGGQHQLYPSEALVKHVYPLLQDATYLSQGQMQMRILRHSRAARFAMILLFLTLLAVLLLLLLRGPF